ncbi:TTF-type domain-containing protein [Heracleum sosnowskyi]|uniref:TTF-type domain-containing protein n=1 Tax=Heracleum sosnowskyi TaxID=360622 RepID=A0AAD8I4E2_9APIA|nr:TTF-type domain-containing protein [Heracleum sosnowskyi]
MDKFVIRTKRVRINNQQTESPEINQDEPEFIQNQGSRSAPVQEQPPVDNTNISEHVIADPDLRPCISTIGFDSAEREKIRRAYLTKGPCQPELVKFPKTDFSRRSRSFNYSWYKFKAFRKWLEYSESKDAAFCLYCYLFNIEFGDNRYKHDAFVGRSFRNWKKRDRLEKHDGDHNSSHSKCMKACEDLLKRKQHVDIMIAGISTQARANYRIRLNATIECVRMLLMQALAFRYHDESETSNNQGNFLAVLKFLCKHNEEVNRVSLKNAPENNILISPTIQKDVCNCASFLTTRAIIEDINDGFFSLLVDEARDSAIKEQMVVGLRYVNSKGIIVERILGIIHVQDTSSQVLKNAIDLLFATHGINVGNFCEKNDIDVPLMDEFFVPRGRSRRTVQRPTNLHHFQVSLFYNVIDFQLQEMNDRFDNVNMELLTCISSLDPRHSFSTFDKHKLIKLAKFYPLEFNEISLMALDDQLDNYILNMRSDNDFSDLKGVAELAQKMVLKQKDLGFPLVYMLVKLALILPVATATVERAFSDMNLIKSVLRNAMGDTWLNDCLVTYIERDVFETISNEEIMQRFQNMKKRRMLL